MIKKVLLLTFLFSCASSKLNEKVSSTPEKIGDFDSFISMCKKSPLKAKKVLEAQRIEGQSAEHWGKVGNCYIEQKNYSKARLFLKIGESIDHLNSRVVEGNARLYLVNKNYHKAYGLFQDIEKFNQTSSLKTLAKLENYFGNYEKSNSIIDRIIKRVDTKETISYIKLSAKNDIALKDFSSAVARFKKHQRVVLRDEESRYLYSYSLANIGDLMEARKMLFQRKPAGQSSFINLYNKVQHFINTETSKKQMQEVHNGPASS